MQTVTIWRRFLSNRSGVFVPIFALVTTALLFSIGIGLDYARALSDRAEGQAVADAMALAMAQQLRLGRPQEEARDAANRLYEAQYGSGSAAASLEIRELADSSGYDVSVSFPGHTETTLMKLARFDELSWQVRAAARVGFGALELTFVADVSYSMLSQGKMEDLRESLHHLVKLVYPGRRPIADRVVSLVPFADSVNFGDDRRYLSWLDPELRNAPYFTGCFRRESLSATTSTTSTAGTLKPYVSAPHGGFRLCPDPERTKVILFESNPTELNFAISVMGNGWGTGTDHALMWGWRTLMPQWRGTLTSIGRYPLDYRESKKVLILLTDGETLPHDPFGNGERLFASGEPVTDPDRINYGVDRLIAVCDAIRQQGKVQVITIGYDIPIMRGAPRVRAMQALKDCPSNGGRHFDASLNGLSDTVDQIIDLIGVIRLYE